MNVLLTGNGFDLAHHLPTKYVDFINIADELNVLDITRCQKIAYIMGKNSHLYKTDAWIRKCCETHKGFGGMKLDTVKMERLRNGSGENLWIQYFIKYKDGNIGWIDFEKEMQEALDIIDLAITKINANTDDFSISRKDMRADQYNKLLSFHEIFKEDKVTKSNIYIKDRYVKKTKTTKEAYAVDTEKISMYLTEELDELINLLDIYFEEIINKISKNWKRKNIYKQIHNIGFQINFNYTNTLENLYDLPESAEICYIHGKAEDHGKNMVLGTRCDKEINNDIFYNFRKYYQCIQKESDYSYRKLLKENSENIYYVWGHSLDETDGDILKEILLNSDKDKFIIFYHAVSSRDVLIRNLISILGTEVFTKFYHNQKIVFEIINEGDLTS